MDRSVVAVPAVGVQANAFGRRANTWTTPTRRRVAMLLSVEPANRPRLEHLDRRTQERVVTPRATHHVDVLDVGHAGQRKAGAHGCVPRGWGAKGRLLDPGHRGSKRLAGPSSSELSRCVVHLHAVLALQGRSCHLRGAAGHRISYVFGGWLWLISSWPISSKGRLMADVNVVDVEALGHGPEQVALWTFHGSGSQRDADGVEPVGAERGPIDIVGDWRLECFPGNGDATFGVNIWRVDDDEEHLVGVIPSADNAAVSATLPGACYRMRVFASAPWRIEVVELSTVDV